MNWVREQFERRMHTNNTEMRQSNAEINFESEVDRRWKELVAGLKRDVEEYRRLGGTVAMVENSDRECRVSNRNAGIAALIEADPAAHTVHYTFESEEGETAVPEGGFFSLRRSGLNGADFYSSDQRVSVEECRRMILEPLLFPAPPKTM